MRTTLRSPSFWNAFALISIVLVGSHAGCDNGGTTTGTSTDVTVSEGTGYHPACKDGVRDGICIPYGQVPETCECLDCVDTAFCKNKCVDDGQCNPGAGEDCTCIDCFGAVLDDGNGGTVDCPHSSAQDGPATTAPASSSSGNGGSGPGSTTVQASSTAATTAATTAAGTGGAGGTTAAGG